MSIAMLDSSIDSISFFFFGSIQFDLLFSEWCFNNLCFNIDNSNIPTQINNIFQISKIII